jgi:chlorobactene glucosyltransferase
MEPALINYQMVVLAGLLLALAAVLLNIASFSSLRRVLPPASRDAPLVAVLVPARNEARNIEACVSSLLAQDYPNYELIVLDDHSDDSTGEIVRQLGLGAAGDRRLISGEPLPAGWTGKNWACHQLARAARGDFLFFTDADTIHAPGTISAAVFAAQENRADLLSAWPRLITRTWGEKLVIPMILVLGMVLYPHWLLRLLQNFPRLPHACRSGCGGRSVPPTVSLSFLPVRPTNASAATPLCAIISSRMSR